MEQPTINVITRNSPLALLQVEELFSAVPMLPYRVIATASYGDKHPEISLLESSIEDLFTRELDFALLRGEADVAVHAAKDLPYPLPAGLELYCLTKAADKSDSLVSRGGLTLAELPAGSRIGTSSKTRKEALLQLRQDLEIVSIRGTIEERIAQVDNGAVDAFIVATCALMRLGLTHRMAQKLPFRTAALQGNLALVGCRKRPELKALFAEQDIRKGFGSVTLVGFGPGDPGLLTLAGDSALAAADLIFHDALVDRPYLDKYSAEKWDVGKRKGSHSYRQDEINELLYQAAVRGKKVVRLKGGDPLVFAHGREEIDYLKSRFIPVSVIPGISAGIALGAYTQIPLTHRGIASSYAFVTGHEEPLQTPSADTLIYYMGGANIPAIANALISRGRRREMPAALVYNLSRPDQRIFYSTLEELRHTRIKYPTPILMLVGEVVALENGAGIAPVLATGTTAVADEACREQITHTPLIEISKRSGSVDEMSQLPLGSYDWILFTSRYGVRFFFEILDQMGVDIRQLGQARIASVGPVTSAELIHYRLRPDLESPTESADGLVDFFHREGISGNEILLPRSSSGLPDLLQGLEQLGNRVTDLALYENRVKSDAIRVDLSLYEKIRFSSPSGVAAFKAIYGELPAGIPLVAKGARTSYKLKQELDETIQSI